MDRWVDELTDGRTDSAWDEGGWMNEWNEGKQRTFHRLRSLPLQLGRIPPKLPVRAKDERDVGWRRVSVSPSGPWLPNMKKKQGFGKFSLSHHETLTTVHGSQPRPRSNIGEVARGEVAV